MTKQIVLAIPQDQFIHIADSLRGQIIPIMGMKWPVTKGTAHKKNTQFLAATDFPDESADEILATLKGMGYDCAINESGLPVSWFADKLAKEQ